MPGEDQRRSVRRACRHFRLGRRLGTEVAAIRPARVGRGHNGRTVGAHGESASARMGARVCPCGEHVGRRGESRVDSRSASESDLAVERVVDRRWRDRARARRDDPNQSARLLLPGLAVLESLHAYPVAGTQLSLAALLLIPVGAVVLNDGISGVRARGAARIGSVALIAATAVLALEGFLAGSHFAAGSPSSLQGAELVRMPSKQAAQLRQLVAAIDNDCSSFITFPGMNSMYIWTCQEPPSDLRYGVWWLTPDPVDQQAVVRQLEGRSRLCVVKNQTLIDFWAQGRPVPSQPVVDFIDGSFVSKATFGDYEVLVRKP